ncbi:spermidine synthase [Gregarina niphandrodes]|uniref:Spermidine synthase n=1 Tax=Gregarina niphandrodes TaxID=110365 RepID=A0A023B6N4_GRENI|nr:spermidine synthase [Gregarina niphandrodes]EZG66651.1 spermidine synthase [Gregarina niphandrodes]|eukprot:XP_011130545.1 spermidine synthase [Gregarina niphandrodes]
MTDQGTKSEQGNAVVDSTQWVTEESQFEKGHGMAQSFRVTKKLHDEQTTYQHLQVFETTNWGNLMVLDGVFQNTEADEFTYHEMQAHVPLFAHPKPERVLIIGGGDGGVAREILKHTCVQEVHLVDIDAAVTAVARKYFPKIASALDDPRLKICHEDGAKYVQKPELQNYFDVICIDSSDPIGPNAVLFKEPFYRNVHACLKENGCAVAQGECMWIHPKTVESVLKMNKNIFDNADYYWHLIPVYPCGVMGLLALTKGKAINMKQIHPDRIAAAKRFTEEDQATMYYTADIHSAAFAKPAFFNRHQTILRNHSEEAA